MTNPEMQAQLEEQKKNCIFCKINKGEMQAKKVYEDNLMFGILDINPCTKGHMLLLPKEHYPIMPLLPESTFMHMFGRLPMIVHALNEAMLATGANVMIANGAAAGQQSPHFLIHILPRSTGDRLDKYGLAGEAAEDETDELIAKNLPAMIQNHFQRMPAEWHTGDIKTSEHLAQIKGKKIYEDEKALCIIPKMKLCKGHVVIYSNEGRELEAVSRESSAHLFYVASFAATAVFEGLGAHGTNIILKTGVSDDNPDGMLSIHILPRFSGDSLDLICPPMTNKPNMDEISDRIRDKTFIVEHCDDKKKTCEVRNLDNEHIDVIGDEITDAINLFRQA